MGVYSGLLVFSFDLLPPPPMLASAKAAKLTSTTLANAFFKPDKGAGIKLIRTKVVKNYAN
jgi:hypothetical protein